MRVVLLVVRSSVAPTAAFVVGSQLSGEPGLVAASVVVGALKDLAAAWSVGRIAIGYLSIRMADVFTRIRTGEGCSARRGRTAYSVGSSAPLSEGEQKMHARKRKEQSDCLASTRR